IFVQEELGISDQRIPTKEGSLRYVELSQIDCSESGLVGRRDGGCAGADGLSVADRGQRNGGSPPGRFLPSAHYSEADGPRGLARESLPADRRLRRRQDPTSLFDLDRA